jgi:glutathionyl-hydroquinone reductase
MNSINQSRCRCHISNKESSDFCPEANRYVLYLQYGCPFAQRVNIALHLKGLERVVDIIALDPTKTAEGFQFTGNFGTMPRDPFYGFSHIRQLYWMVDPDLRAPFTIPLLWDRKREVIVNNESGEMMRMFYDCFDHLLPEDRHAENMPGGGLYPKSLQGQIDAMNEWVQRDINNGVYDVAAAEDQETYDDRVQRLFKSLSRVENHLAERAVTGGGSGLFGDLVTEADIRLFTSVVRFDVAYHTTLRCGAKTIRNDYPHIHRWMQTLYWDNSPLTNYGAFRKTTNFEHVSLSSQDCSMAQGQV